MLTILRMMLCVVCISLAIYTHLLMISDTRNNVYVCPGQVPTPVYGPMYSISRGQCNSFYTNIIIWNFESTHAGRPKLQVMFLVPTGTYPGHCTVFPWHCCSIISIMTEPALYTWMWGTPNTQDEQNCSWIGTPLAPVTYTVLCDSRGLENIRWETPNPSKIKFNVFIY